MEPAFFALGPIHSMDLETRHALDSAQPDANRGPTILGATCALQAISLAVVGLAFYSRACIVRKLAVYDYVMVAAWVITFGMSATIVYAVHYGMGHHDSEISLSSGLEITRALYGFSILYQIGLMAQKTGILLLYLAVLSSDNITRYFTIATIAFVDVGGFALALLSVFRCSPITAALDTPLTVSSQSSNCISLLTIYLTSAPLNIITDIAILLLPMPSLWSLRLPKRQKLALVVTFGFGIFVTIVDVVRVAYLEQASTSILASFLGLPPEEPEDFSWFASFGLMWSAVELNVGLICSCVPVLKPLLAKTFAKGHPDAQELENELDGQHPGQFDRLSSLQEPPDCLHIEDIGAFCAQFPAPGLNNNNSFSRTPTLPLDPPDLDENLQPLQSSLRYPVIAMVVLFFVWGMEYGLLYVLNQEFQTVARLSSSQAVALNSAYYAGYVFGPPCLAYPIMKSSAGFKTACIVGLGIYACGSLVFWPAAVLNSFPAYFISNLIAGFGLSVLEAAADTWTFAFGPSDRAETRLCFAQAVQASGTVIATSVMDVALQYRSVSELSVLVRLQWLYLGIALFAVILGVVYYMLPVPTPELLQLKNPSSDEMSSPGNRQQGTTLHSPRYATLVLGAFAQFCYVGAQEVNATSMHLYFAATIERTWTPSAAVAVAHTAFAISRFLAAGLVVFVQPRIVLLLVFLGAILFQVLSMLGQFTDSLSATFFVLTLFMEGPLFPLIFCSVLHDQGGQKATLLSAIIMTASIGGGGSSLAPIGSALQSFNDGGASISLSKIQLGLSVAVAALAAGVLFPAYQLWPKKARGDQLREDEEPVSPVSMAAQRPNTLQKIGAKSDGFIELDDRT